ncbi:acetyl-CoA acetyltransferase [Nitrogeniibacter mangrovi]|uniref:Acetyl-CoA acetyltransferase n=1 Tax=Nitrogeniibacter mangrovi TaxID=2016596 RepID=A0A6C1AYF2_9RHOO|nr:acetyl-CoA acetyltransferase [Nitrogeniibacter mangrovi]QID16392.1 acetyl-CoA acetyltransferase [Nitrogeniibacter mangrovi]
MNACIIGWGHTRFGKHDDANLEALIVSATREALEHAGVDGRDVDAIWLGHLGGGLVPEIFTSSLVMQADPSLRWRPATRVENACASGAGALFAACDAIAAGRTRIALVVGAEKMTGVSGADVTRVLGSASYYKEEGARGETFPGIFAHIAQDYATRYGDPSEAMARIAAKNHANGALNPLAHMQRDVGFEFCNTVSDKNPLIVGNLRKTDCSLVSDGAAAIVLVSEDIAANFKRAVRIRSRAQVSDLMPMSARDVTSFEGPRRAWAQALDAAGLRVNDLSLAEVHDCFTIAELLAYEAMGLAAPGQGARVLEEGLVMRDGKLPVNASGGLKSKGHPIGATGVSMHVMAAMQLTGTAGQLQVPDAELAAIFNMGGAAVANYVSILEPVR